MTLYGDDVTRLIRRLSDGDADAGDELLPLIYDELHRLAAGYMRGQRKDHTLQATALVHEAYLKLLGGSGTDWADRTHFLAVAARAMRQVLLDHARARKTAKRGGGEGRVSLEDAAVVDTLLDAFEDRAIDVLELDAALNELNELDEQLARLVELRFFAGLTMPEVARVMEMSLPTVERRWRTARTWLADALQSGEGPAA